MPTTSQKVAEFVRENMKDKATGGYKDIDTIGGVGPKAKEVLAGKGFTKAFHLLVCPVYLPRHAIPWFS